MTKKKASFKDAWASFLSALRVLFVLVKMQLKEKMDVSYLRSLKQTVFKAVWFAIEFAAVTALVSVLFYFVKVFGLFSLVHDIPVSVVSIIFAVMLLLSLITDTVGLTKSLYLSRDNTVLLTFPATPSLIFLSKLCVYYVHELRKSFMFVIPMFIGYGIIQGYALYYYPWLFLMFALVSVLPVLLAALLSIPAMFVHLYLEKVKALKYSVYGVLTGGATVLVWLLIGLIPQNINFVEQWGEIYWKLQEVLKAYTVHVSPIYKFTELIVGRTKGMTNDIFHEGTLPILLILMASILVCLALCFLLSKPLFCRMASTPFEFKKKNSAKEKINKKRSPFASALRKELLVGVRSGALMRLFAILILVMPVAIFLLGKLYAAMSTRFLGNQMTICFNALIMLLILLMTNMDIASVYSRDGFSSYLNKVQPTPYGLLLFAKLFYPLVLGFVGTAFSTVVFCMLSSVSVTGAVFIGITVYGIFVGHLFSSAEMDIVNPQSKQYATFSDQFNNPNERTAAVVGIILPLIVFGIALFLSSKEGESTWIKLAVVAVAYAAFKVYTYFMKIKAFYKEVQ